MSATTTAPAMPQMVALLILDGAWGALDEHLNERMDCVACKAAAGWCGDCFDVDAARTEIGKAQTQVRATHSDRQATQVLLGVMGRLAGISEVALAVVLAGGAQ